MELFLSPQTQRSSWFCFPSAQHSPAHTQHGLRAHHVVLLFPLALGPPSLWSLHGPQAPPICSQTSPACGTERTLCSPGQVQVQHLPDSYRHRCGLEVSRFPQLTIPPMSSEARKLGLSMGRAECQPWSPHMDSPAERSVPPGAWTSPLCRWSSTTTPLGCPRSTSTELVAQPAQVSQAWEVAAAVRH